MEGEEIAYKFTPKYVLRAGQTVTVGGRGRPGGGRVAAGDRREWWLGCGAFLRSRQWLEGAGGSGRVTWL